MGQSQPRWGYVLQNMQFCILRSLHCCNVTSPMLWGYHETLRATNNRVPSAAQATFKSRCLQAQGSIEEEAWGWGTQGKTTHWRLDAVPKGWLR